MIDSVTVTAQITAISARRLARLRKSAEYWMGEAGHYIKAGRDPGFSRDLGERRLADYFDEIERILRCQPPR